MQCLLSRGFTGHVRGQLDSRHLREVVGTILCGSVVVQSSIRGTVVYAGRRARSAAWRSVDKESLLCSLAASIVRVQGATDILVWTEHAFGCTVPVLVWPADNAQDKVGRVVVSAQRVAVFPHDEISHIIYEIILAYGDHCGRGIGPLDPYFSRQHAGNVGDRGVDKVVRGCDGGRRSRGRERELSDGVGTE
jgi:hypothetical protein